MTTAAALPGHLRRLARSRWSRPVLVVGLACGAVVTLRGRLPDLAATWDTLGDAEPTWLAVAALLQLSSMAAFAEQQRHLLAGFGVRIPARLALAISYARSAMSTALPAGSALSAAYAFRQFRAHGATREVATTTMLLSGFASTAGLLLLYAGGALTTAPSQSLALTAAVLLATAAGATTVRKHVKHRNPTPESPRPARTARTAHRARTAQAVRRLIATLRETAALARGIPARRWAAVLSLAVVNWVTDLCCLLASLQAVNLDVRASTVAVAYLVAQLARQIPITPGGIGIIEASLVVALTTAGAAAAPAAAAVLLYRLFSCWAVLPIGLTCWSLLRTPATLPATTHERQQRHAAATA